MIVNSRFESTLFKYFNILLQMLNHFPIFFKLILKVKNIHLIGLHHLLDGVTNPEYKLLYFIQQTKFFCKEEKALAFNQDRCCHLALFTVDPLPLLFNSFRIDPFRLFATFSIVLTNRSSQLLRRQFWRRRRKRHRRNDKIVVDVPSFRRPHR
jgi:hypothetical protein